MSPELQGFYNAMAEWVNADTPDNNVLNFCKGYGLCANLGNYLDCLAVPNDISDSVRGELAMQFIEAGLTPLYPFNNVATNDAVTFLGERRETEITFISERKRNELYSNPRRLAWIHSHSS